MDTSSEYIKKKVCPKCELRKHLYDFCVDTSKNDGRSGYCKRCKSLYNWEHPKPKELNRINNDKYKKTEKYLIKHREDCKKHRDKYPDRVRARLVSLFLEKQPCMICGEKAEVHHLDYSKPLKVIWLCKKHHEMLDHKQLEQTEDELWMSAQST